MPGLQRVMIVGAGLAGLACADALRQASVPYRIVDKGRGAGGRLSTRRSSFGRFDHGAPHLKVRDPQFAAKVAYWQDKGLVAPCDEEGGTPTIVGTPDMNSFLRHEAERHEVEFGLEIGAPLKRDKIHRLFTTAGEPVGEAEMVVFAAPAPQTADRLPSGSLRDAPLSVTYNPIWTMMAAWSDDQQPCSWNEAERPSALGSLHWQNERPERAAGCRLVAHATAEWSEDHLELQKTGAATRLMDSLREAYGAVPSPVFLEAHRWRYARVVNPVGTSYGLDEAQGLATCGDWHLGPDGEHAWLSGHRLGEALASLLAS